MASHDHGIPDADVDLADGVAAVALPAQLAAEAGGKSVPPSTAPLSAKSQNNLVLGVAVVQFHHQVGPQVEHTFPPRLMEDKDLMMDLPFFALPDGSHLVRPSRSLQRRRKLVGGPLLTRASLMRISATSICTRPSLFPTPPSLASAASAKSWLPN